MLAGWPSYGAGAPLPATIEVTGSRARRLADTKYSYEAYLSKTRVACAHLTGEATPQVAGGVA